MRAFLDNRKGLVGLIGVLIAVLVLVGALQYKQLPFFNAGRDYTAYFAEASGLQVGNAVQVSGYRVGEVQSVDLDGSRVVITFKISDDVNLGDRTEVAIRTKSLLGAKVLEVTPRGEGRQSGPIPLDRTTPAYQLPDAVADLSRTVGELNTDSLNQSLSTLAETFRNTPVDLQTALSGLGRLSDSLNQRDAQLRGLLANANKATTVLGERTDQVVGLIADTNALLAQLRTESGALDSIAGNVSAATQQLSGFIDENRETFKPAVDKLNGVLTILDNRKADLQKAVKLLNSYAMSLGESLASGPFFKAYIGNLLPGQFIQPFVDAAFSDLGLDPNVSLPSERIDPPTGQPGTPALPVPYPRTGQGGEPRLNLPDAITGTPGDQPCGPPGIALPGPGCYPYREPLPAPPPGGPPPGPPAAAPPGLESVPQPTPAPVYELAPGEPAGAPAPGSPASTSGGQ